LLIEEIAFQSAISNQQSEISDQSVPWIVDYTRVLEEMRQQGLRSLYYNSGAFGFPDGAEAKPVGWIGPDDPTLRPEARGLALPVPPPYEQNLARLLVRAWRDLLPGAVWIMPRSHWAYELDFGSRDWMPALLEHAGIDQGLLAGRTNAAAIEFTPTETGPFAHLVEGLLRMLLGSDFALAFPGRPVTCTLHHHKQIWWSSSDPQIVLAMRQLAG
jgi:hypothetical protein